MDRQRKMYRAIINFFCEHLYPAEPEQVHKELKVGYNIHTTTRFTKKQRTEYLDYTIQMFIEAHKIYFNSEYFIMEGVKYTKIYN